MTGFREIIHTADVGLKISADSIENLFIIALNGYYKLVLSDDYSCNVLNDYIYTTDESDYENLLITFLSEINYLLMAKNQIIRPVQSTQIKTKNKKYTLTFNGHLNYLNNPDTAIRTEIKAVTYHQVEIIKESGIFKTKIFFDI